MVNYSCIAIGINRYQFIQPLGYGEADAQELGQFWQEKHGNPSCLLLTDTSPWIENQDTYPNQENILNWLQALVGQVQTDSPLWFFFSGYGVTYEGEDYLMPIEGNPDDVVNTGISIRTVMNSLNAATSDCLLVLDINRSPGFAEEGLGAATSLLAQEKGIPVIFSSQLNELSHEIGDLGHGMFTVALLESLRYYRDELTLAQLDQYLRDRLPELSQHHWKPEQIPLTIIPEDGQPHKHLLPLLEKSPMVVTTGGIENGKAGNGSQSNNGHNPSPASPPNREDEANSGGSITVVPSSSPPPSNLKRNLIALGLLFIAILGFEPVVSSWVGSLSQETEVTSNPDADIPSTDNSTESNPELPPENAGIPPIPNVDSEESIPSPNQAEVPIAPASLPPAADQPIDPERLAFNQAVLSQARIYIQSNQASGFSRAIAETRKIKVGDPLYDEAQADVRRWSEVIYDIARGRANNGQFQMAIAAAKLMPGDDPNLQGQAIRSIEQWKQSAKQQAFNTLTLQNAKEQLLPNQASSYSRAIGTVGKIPPKQPGYAAAQKLTVDWSRQIYLIANSRAAKGNFQQAIETAKFVPVNTPSYEQAQKAIARWQKGER